MKILFITSRGDVGGGVVHLLGLLENFLQNPSFSIFLAAPDEIPLAPFFKSNGGVENFYAIPKRRFSLLVALSLGLFCRKNQIELVHSHGIGAEFYGRLVSYISGAKQIHTPHGIHVDRYGPIKRFIVKNFEVFGLSPLKRIVCVSESERSIADSLGLWPNVVRVVIHNGINDIALSASERTSARRMLGVTESQKIILTIGRFDPVKNYTELLSVAKLCPDITFWIVGDGENFVELKFVAQKNNVNNVVFWGARSDVKNFYASADLYLSTSIREGLPLTLIEASAYGVPVICTEVPGNVDVVKDGITGYWYKRGDIDRAVTLIHQTFSDPKNLAVLGKNACVHQREFFSIKTSMHAYEVLYFNIIRY